MTTVLFNSVPVSVPAAAVTVISAEPLKLVPLIVLAVSSAVAVEALPTKLVAVNATELELKVKLLPDFAP